MRRSISRSQVAFGRLRAALLLVTTVAAGCSNDQQESNPAAPADKSSTTTTLALPRFQTSGLRLEVSPTEPLAVYNVYPSSSQPELIEQVVKLWPKDLLPYLAIQIIPNELDELSTEEKAQAVDAMLSATDKAQVAVILQTLTLFGDEGPGEAAVDKAFEDHPSLVGIGVAEQAPTTQPRRVACRKTNEMSWPRESNRPLAMTPSCYGQTWVTSPRRCL